MSSLYLYAEPTVTFVTINGTYPVVTRSTSNAVPSDSYDYFSDGLISFQTDNDNEQNQPAATITLTDAEDWATLLVPNDYVKIDMRYRSNAFSDEADQIVDTCLYCGLISEVRKTTSPSANTREYTITAAGVAKIMSNINLSTFSELTSAYSAYQLLPDDAKTGIKFGGRTSANIIKQVLTKFVTGTNDFVDYDYTGVNSTSYSTSDILSWSNDTIIENTDESFQDSVSNQFSNYNGSILSMVQDIAVKPFNEIYWTHEEGVATFHYRPTPFDETDWNNLDRIQISTDDVLDEELSVSDQDQYSIFKLLSESTLGTYSFSGGWSGYLAPLTNKELIRRYGYKTKEVETDYFNGNATEDTSALQTGKDSDSGNQNLSSKTKAFASQVTNACATYNCTSLYPYAMAILELELDSGASTMDPANATSHGASSISSSQDSINYLVNLLNTYWTLLKSNVIDDKLAMVQAYNFGKGFISYLSDQNASSLTMTYSINYSKKLAKANGNSSLATVSYNTAVSRSYGKNYIYKNGGNFYYAYEAKQYIGNAMSSTTNSSNNSGASTTTVTEAEAQLSYPPYETIENIFAVAEGKTASDTVSIPAKYGGVSTYQTILQYLTNYSSRATFVSKATGLGGVITKTDAEQIYSQYHTSGISGDAASKMSRARYLNIIAPEYTPTASSISSSSTYLKSKSKIKANPKKAAIELMEEVNYTLGSKQSYEIVETWINNNGSISESEYEKILSTYSYNDTEDGVDPINDTGSTGSVPYLFQMYTRKLFNWYADNSKFHSGTIKINGTSGIEIGKRLLMYDPNENVYWEYYIEAVSQDYSVENGWTTSIGVTRGLPLSSEDDQRRFTYPKSFWGSWQVFRGGYFGENDLETSELLASNSSSDADSDSIDDSSSSSGSDSFSGGSSIAKKAAKYAVQLAKESSSYTENGTWRTTDFFTQSEPIKGDCSSFVYWCYARAGLDISNNGTYTTQSFQNSSNLKIVNKYGSNKTTAYNNIKVGDLVYFDTDQKLGHVGIAYSGGIVAFNTSSGITKFSLKGNSYWWGVFDSEVQRPNS